MAQKNETKCKQALKRAKLPIRELEKVWLSSAEMCAWLDCSDDFLAKLRDGAQVTFARVGGKYYHEAASVLRLFEKNKIASIY